MAHDKLVFGALHSAIALHDIQFVSVPWVLEYVQSNIAYGGLLLRKEFTAGIDQSGQFTIREGSERRSEIGTLLRSEPSNSAEMDCVYRLLERCLGSVLHGWLW